jgi:ribosomal protein S27AE
MKNKKSKRPETKPVFSAGQSCWFTHHTCPMCGYWLATNGKRYWCGNENCSMEFIKINEN